MSLLLRMAGVDVKSKKGLALAVGLGEPNPRPELMKFLVESAAAFLIAGGAWSPEGWAKLMPLERAACTEAGERVRLATAKMTASMLRGGREAAEAEALFDGGAAVLALEDQAMASAMDDLIKRTRATLSKVG